jgi:hypothetical protein
VWRGSFTTRAPGNYLVGRKGRVGYWRTKPKGNEFMEEGSFGNWIGIYMDSKEIDNIYIYMP